MSLENEEEINSKKVLFAKKTDSGLIWLEPHEAEDWYGTFLGEVKDLQPHGQGIFISIDGLKYIGEWYSPKSGKGKFTWSNGKTYEGEWSNGKEHGKGILTLINGATYKGEFKQGIREGDGIFYHSNGDIYDGEWKKGKPHGKGKYTWKDGQQYVGDFKNGEMSGIGEKTWPYDPKYIKSRKDNDTGLGKSYCGELLGGIPHGSGEWKYRNGKMFSGIFNKGKREGFGKLIDPSGDIICQGHYSQNELDRSHPLTWSRNKSHRNEYDDDYTDASYESDESSSAWDLAPDGMWSDDWDDSSYSHEEWSVSDYNTELWYRGGLIEDDEWAESDDYDEWSESDD